MVIQTTEFSFVILIISLDTVIRAFRRGLWWAEPTLQDFSKHVGEPPAVPYRKLQSQKFVILREPRRVERISHN